MKNAISNINPDNILKTLSLSKYNDRILESLWHFEFYRILYDLLPRDIRISPEFGKIFTDGGSIDLYIPFYGWAIELLVDGCGMKEHYTRFQIGNSTSSRVSKLSYFILIIFIEPIFYIDGIYSDIPINDYILIDIRQTIKANKLYPKTWHIHPNVNYPSFDIKCIDRNGLDMQFTIPINIIDVKNNDIDFKNNVLIFSLAILTTVTFVLSSIIAFLLYKIYF